MPRISAQFATLILHLGLAWVYTHTTIKIQNQQGRAAAIKT